MKTWLVLLLLLCSAWSQQIAPPDGCTNPSEDQYYKWNRTLKKVECSPVSAGGSGSSAWADITGKPATFPSDWTTTANKPATYPASSHSHPQSDITNLVSDLAGKAASAHTHVKANITDFTHSHAQADITNLTSDLAGKAASVHAHAIADVTNLQTSLNGKAASSHTHAIADSTGLQATLDGKAASAHSHNANAACSGNDKVRGFDASGVPICAADQTSAGGSGPTVLRVASADYTNSTVNFSDVTGLTTPVAANTTYNFTCDLIVSAAAATTGIQLAMTAPASPTHFRYTVRATTSATAIAFYSGTANDNTTGVPTASAGTALTTNTITGQLVNGANAGTLAVRARSEIAASAITIYRGSSCLVF